VAIFIIRRYSNIRVMAGDLLKDPAIWMAGGALAGDGILYIYINNALASRDREIADLRQQLTALKESLSSNLVATIAREADKVSEKRTEAVKKQVKELSRQLRETTDEMSRISYSVSQHPQHHSYAHDSGYSQLSQRQTYDPTDRKKVPHSGNMPIYGQQHVSHGYPSSAGPRIIPHQMQSQQAYPQHQHQHIFPSQARSRINGNPDGNQPSKVEESSFDDREASDSDNDDGHDLLDQF
jgi:gas vesicle protein